MLLEDMYVVIYGGGGRSEGQLTVMTGADVGNAAAFWPRTGRAVTAPAANLACGTVVD